MTNISPMFWKDGWPVWGTPDAPGRVPATATKPIQGQKVSALPASDDFSARTLGLQWQWNHNPVARDWSLTERPGWSSLRALREQRLCVFPPEDADVLVRPGPRMAEGARIMARCLASKAAPGAKAPAAVRP